MHSGLLFINIGQWNPWLISPSFSDKGYWERIEILSKAIYEVIAPIEASAFTPEEWKAEKSLIVDYARNGTPVE